MIIKDKIKNICEKNEILTSKEIKNRVQNKYATNRDSIIPSDYCYNITNLGANEAHFFIYLEHNKYHYVGEDYNYSGNIYHTPKGSKERQLVGVWENGKKRLFPNIIKKEETKPVILPKKDQDAFRELNQDDISRLYEEYLKIFDLEVKDLGCKPTEVRHLMGRIGEFKIALHTKGRLAKNVNQHGFDVITTDGRKISVKATAQKRNQFFSINKKTTNKIDQIALVLYEDNEFNVYGPVDYNDKLVKTVKPREYDYTTTYEFPIKRFIKYCKKFPVGQKLSEF